MVVSNSSPLVYLAALGDFELLRFLFQEIIIPPAVFEEVVIGGAQFPVAREVVAAQGRWIHVHELRDGSKAGEFRNTGLDAGES